MVSEYLLGLCELQNSPLRLLAESVDSLVDVLCEDYLDPICKQLKLIQRLQVIQKDMLKKVRMY